MGKRGHQSVAGKGEKEEDGSPRNTRVEFKLSKSLVEQSKLIAKRLKISLTDLVSQALREYLKAMDRSDE